MPCTIACLVLVNLPDADQAALSLTICLQAYRNMTHVKSKCRLFTSTSTVHYSLTPCNVSIKCQSVAGTCTIGSQQSPINIPLADHLAQSAKQGSAGWIKFQFEQSFGNGKDVKFNFEQQLEKSADTKFKFEQQLDGNIKIGFEANLYEQKLDRMGDIKFHYDNQSGAVVTNPGHGTPQVSKPTVNTVCI